MENNIVDYCKEKLRAINCTALLTPVEIENLARKNPNIICNELTEELATAIIKKDLLSLRVICEFGSMVNTSISNLLDKVVKKGDSMLIHHYRDKNYFTSLNRKKCKYSRSQLGNSPAGELCLCFHKSEKDWSSPVFFAFVT